MDKVSAKIRYNQWKQIVLEANNSTLSKKAWCRENGISEKQLYYWQRKIRRREAASLPVSLSGQAVPAVTDPAGEFVELSFQASLQEQVAVCPDRPVGIRTVLIEAGSLRIYVGDGIREDTLRTVLAVARDA